LCGADAGNTVPAHAVGVRLQWRISQDVEAGPAGDLPFVGAVAAVATTADGGTVFLDSQFKQVAVVDSLGRYVTSVGGEGEGPGEYNQPVSLAVDAGGRIVVGEAVPATAIAFTPGGEYIDSWRLKLRDRDSALMATLSRLAVMDRGYCVQGTQIVFGGDQAEIVGFLVLADDEFREVARVIDTRAKMDPRTGQFDTRDLQEVFAAVWTAAGYVYVAADPTVYSFEIRDRTGEVVRVVTRDVARRKYSPEERREIQDRIGKALAKMPARAHGGDYEAPEFRPLLLGMRMQASALLVWTDTTVDAVGGTLDFDVFGEGGEYIGPAAVRIDGLRSDDRVFIAEDGPLVVRGQIDAVAGLPVGGTGGSEVVVLTRYVWPELSSAAGVAEAGR
jgi:hypothetical protein